VCNCECVSLTGQKSIAEYRALKLETKLIAAFTVEDMKLRGGGVQVDYLSYGASRSDQFSASVLRARYYTQVATRQHAATPYR